MYTTYEKSGYTRTIQRFQSLLQDVMVPKGKTIHTTTRK